MRLVAVLLAGAIMFSAGLANAQQTALKITWTDPDENGYADDYTESGQASGRRGRDRGRRRGRDDGD